jgi:hypothetical protein
MTATSVVSIINGHTSHNFLVRDADFAQSCEDFGDALLGLVDDVSVDMGDFAAAFCTAMRTGYGGVVCRLLPEECRPGDIYQSDTAWHYVISRDPRIMKLEIKQVLLEDKHRLAVPVWSGTMHNFRKNIKVIAKNIGDRREKP